MRTLLAISFLLPAASFAQSACPAQHPVGYRLVQSGALKMAVWYPSTGVEAPFNYPARNPITGSVIQNGPVSTCARFPLVVFSHGYGGCGTQSVFFTEHAARQGYVVVSMDHKDANCSIDGSNTGSGTVTLEPFRNPETWTDQTFIDRRDDMRAALDFILNNGDFRAAIDPARIAGAGHSLGGYTVFGLLGGWPSWKDERVKAGLLFSPYLEPYRIQNAIPRVTAPAMYQGGTLDIGITPGLEASGGVYDRGNTPKFLPVLSRAGHLAWTNSSCSNVVSCNASDETVRAINGYALAFLDLYLKGKEDVTALWTRLGGVNSYRRNIPFGSVSSASFEATALPPDAIGSGFTVGTGLAASTIAAPEGNSQPETLGGLSVVVTDSTGNSRRAPIYFVSPRQINYIMPRGTANGTVQVAVRDSNDTIASGTATVEAVWPTFFSAARDGKGAPAAEILTVRADGSRTSALAYDASLQPVAIDVRSGEVYLILYGTGFRAARASEATARIGSTAIPVLALAASPQYAGLDQVALGPLPASLAGAGMQELRVTVGARTSNAVTVRLQ